LSCTIIQHSTTSIFNPETGDVKAFVLDYAFDSSTPPAASSTGNSQEEDHGREIGDSQNPYADNAQARLNLNPKS
jgi:hypothetical protein